MEQLPAAAVADSSFVRSFVFCFFDLLCFSVGTNMRHEISFTFMFTTTFMCNCWLSFAKVYYTSIAFSETLLLPPPSLAYSYSLFYSFFFHFNHNELEVFINQTQEFINWFMNCSPWELEKQIKILRVHKPKKLLKLG